MEQRLLALAGPGHFGKGILLVNGDTVHPVSVERTLLAASDGNTGADLILALDDVKKLADEEMKVVLNERGLMTKITKQMDPADAHGEYIGATLIEPGTADALADALEATWRRDPACITRTVIRSLPTGAERWRSRRSASSSGSRSMTTGTCGEPGRSPAAARVGGWPPEPRRQQARPMPS